MKPSEAFVIGIVVTLIFIGLLAIYSAVYNDTLSKETEFCSDVYGTRNVVYSAPGTRHFDCLLVDSSGWGYQYIFVSGQDFDDWLLAKRLEKYLNV